MEIRNFERAPAAAVKVAVMGAIMAAQSFYSL